MIGTVNLLIVVWGLQMITPAYLQILNSTTTYNRTDHKDYPISPDDLNDTYNYFDDEEIRHGRNNTNVIRNRRHALINAIARRRHRLPRRHYHGQWIEPPIHVNPIRKKYERPCPSSIVSSFIRCGKENRKWISSEWRCDNENDCGDNSDERSCGLEVSCFWRQSASCRWDGPREEGSDKGCCDTISDGWPGYCECANGTKTMKKGCEKGAFSSCKEACQDDGPCSKLFYRFIQNIHNHIKRSFKIYTMLIYFPKLSDYRLLQRRWLYWWFRYMFIIFLSLWIKC